MTYAIDIPESARTPKAVFKEYPGEKIANEVRQYVKETGTPHLWWGHTHSKPPPGGQIVYVEEFDLPSNCKPREKWAPCPCCTFDKAQYRRDGKIAWFPEEHLIRLIGGDCYKRLDAKGHEDAMVQLRKTRQMRADLNYLLANIEIVPRLLRGIYDAKETATALDEFRRVFAAFDGGRLSSTLLREMREGTLRVSTSQTVTRVDSDLQETTFTQRGTEVYAQIDGYQILTPHAYDFEPELAAIRKELLPFNKSKSDVQHETPDFRNKAARVLSKKYKALSTCFEDMRVAQRFFSPVTVATLRTWGAMEDATLRMTFDFKHGVLTIGLRGEPIRTFEVANAATKGLPILPELANTEL